MGGAGTLPSPPRFPLGTGGGPAAFGFSPGRAAVLGAGGGLGGLGGLGGRRSFAPPPAWQSPDSKCSVDRATVKAEDEGVLARPGKASLELDLTSAEVAPAFDFYGMDDGADGHHAERHLLNLDF
jgi:hypothetical protein